MISVPAPSLMHLQKWIVNNILQFTTPHPTSHAFHPDCRPYEAAAAHCGCSWLLKVDVEDFFHGISERRVTRVFQDIGFPKLLSFEFARLATFAIDRVDGRPDPSRRWPVIPLYQCRNEGVLPQGAPTSPMLSNLVMYTMDATLQELAEHHGFRFTRYADDLAFSCKDRKDISEIRRFKRLVLKSLNEGGFKPNHRKTAIRGPGSRRIVLGMLVDSDRPRLPRDYKDKIRLHLHFLRSATHGPSVHAAAQRTSISGIYHHVRGLISWAQTVEPDFGASAMHGFGAIEWPPLGPQ
ncbi:reverse transcriptase family protein [Pseudohaliea sp.]|uniref:reverse transcriptase family protein n=1 Tax=Pseudohaliea sp. TaxID=2740289 RepID=UPI0032EBA786